MSSKCAWERSTMSILGRSRTVSAGAVRRLGPSVRPGNRIPIRGNRTGSVRIFIPKKLINTVACPSHAAVIWLSLHSAGFGRADHLDAVADRGYFNSPEILACGQVDITGTLPKAMTSGAKADGR